MLRKKTRLSAIGLEIDAHEFRAVQLINSPTGISTLAWAIFPRRADVGPGEKNLPSADELRWAGSILGRRGFVGNSISIAPPSDSCSSHVIELPPIESGAPIEQLARQEVARERRCAPGDFQIGYWSLPVKGRTQETRAVACPRPIIEHMLDRFEDGGFVPVGVGLIELAIHRAGQVHSEIDNEINASLHVGWSSSLAVLTLGDTVIYVRRIEHGASRVWDMATGRYGLSPRAAEEVIHDQSQSDCVNGYTKIKRATWSSLAAELASELDVTYAYVSHSFRTAPFGKIRLSGYGAANPVIDEHLDQILGIPVECAAPIALIQGIGHGPEVWSCASRLSTAYGLAARFDR